MWKHGDFFVCTTRRRFFFYKMLHTQPALGLFEKKIAHARLRRAPQAPGNDFRQWGTGGRPGRRGCEDKVKIFHSGPPDDSLATVAGRIWRCPKNRHATPVIQAGDGRLAQVYSFLTGTAPYPRLKDRSLAPHLLRSEQPVAGCRLHCSASSLCTPICENFRPTACLRCGR